MKKTLLVLILFLMASTYAFIEYKYTRKEVSIVIPFSQLIKQNSKVKKTLLKENVYFTYSNIDEYNYYKLKNILPSQLVYMYSGGVFPKGFSKARAIFSNKYINNNIQVNKDFFDYSKKFSTVFTAEIIKHAPLNPVDTFGIRLRWIHFIKEQEHKKLSKKALSSRLKRALLERNIRAIFYNFSDKLPWADFEKLVLNNYKKSLSPRNVFFNWDRVRLLFTFIFISLLFFECKWIVLSLFPLYLEYPMGLQLSGFLFSQISIFHLYTLFSKDLKRSKEILVLTRLFSIWIKAILFGFTYYFMMDYQDFDQRFYLARGVKVSLLLMPSIILIYELVKNYKYFFYSKKENRLKFLIMFMVIFAITYLIIIRSGNNPYLLPSHLELLTRDYLEEIFLARPRFKELLGLFSLVLLYQGLKKENLAFQLISKVMFGLYLATFFNSFSHFHTSFWFIYLRELNTLILGVLPLLFLVFLDLFFLRKRDATLHLGYFGFGNFGDELLKLCLIQNDVSGNDWYIVKSYSTNSHRKKEITRSSLENIIISLSNKKYFSLGPGGIFQDRTSSFSFYYYILFCFLAKLFGAKIVWNYQGFSPLNSFFNKKILLVTSYLTEKIVVRDEDSFSYLEKIGVSSLKLTLKKDLVYEYNISVSKEEKEDHIAIVLRSWKGAPLKDWIKEISKTGLKRVYFIFQKDSFLKKTIEMIDPKAIIKEFSNEPQSYYREISKHSKIISMRFHGLVLGDIFNLDILALNYDKKCETFSNERSLKFILNERDFMKENLFKDTLRKLINK